MIILGGGIIGLTLAIELDKQNVQVLVAERGEPGREASRAAAGMLADGGIEDSSPLKTLATTSARMYPEFVHQLQDESGMNCDLRDQGTLQFSSDPVDALAAQEIAEHEPALATSVQVKFMEERSVDPVALTSAALKAAKHRGIDISSGSEAQELLSEAGKSAGVRTDKTEYHAAVVVNCLGAWAGQFGPIPLPVRPVKGQMLSVVGGPPLNHVIRGTDHDVYIVPRSDGRILIGSTVEETGFDKRTMPDVIRRMQKDALRLVPALAQSRMIEAWAGLRPGTPDNFPILGATLIPGYFVATGHFRDGILLAPVTARLMAQVITGKKPDCDLSAFSATRFSSNNRGNG